MTKKYILGSIFLATSLFANENNYHACSEDKQSAKEALAQSISTKVETKIEDFKSESRGSLFNFTQSDVSVASKQSSSAILHDITFTHEGTQWCASIDKKKFHQDSLNFIMLVSSYRSTNLPNNSIKAKEMLKKWIEDTNYAFSLLPLMKEDDIPQESKDSLFEIAKDRIKNAISKKSSKIEKLSAILQKNKKEFLDKVAREKIVVTVEGSTGKLTIDGKEYKQLSDIYLNRGNYHYTYTANGSCPIEGTIDVKENEENHIVLETQKYQLPTLTISSNKSSAKLTIDGENWNLGKEKVIHSCDGKEIAYKITFEDEVIEGTFTKTPNNKYVKSFSFLSAQEQQELRERALSYTEGKRLEVKYAFHHITAANNLEDYENINALQINLLDVMASGWIRYGAGLEYGSGTESTIAEATAQAYFQIADIGKGSLSVGKIVFVPYFGVKTGLSYYSLYNTKTENSLENFSSKTDDYLKDYYAAKGVVGFDIAYHKIGFNFFAEKSLRMAEELTYGLGVSLKL